MYLMRVVICPNIGEYRQGPGRDLNAVNFNDTVRSSIVLGLHVGPIAGVGGDDKKSKGVKTIKET